MSLGCISLSGFALLLLFTWQLHTQKSRRDNQFSGGTLSSTTGSRAFSNAPKQMLTEKKLTRIKDAGHAFGPGHAAGSPSANTNV